jgi:hypothetical protein
LAPVANCSTFVRRHILELGEDRARLRPFAVLAESDFTGHGLKTVAVHVIRERVLIEATRCLDGLRQNLSGGIAERHEAVAEGIKLFARRYCAIALEHIGEAGKLERRRRHEAFHDDEAVENRTELRLDRRYQQPDHGAAEHLRRQPDLMRGAHDADGIGRIGGNEDDIGVGSLEGAHGRRKIGRGRRIALS